MKDFLPTTKAVGYMKDFLPTTKAVGCDYSPVRENIMVARDVSPWKKGRRFKIEFRQERHKYIIGDETPSRFARLHLPDLRWSLTSH